MGDALSIGFMNLLTDGVVAIAGGLTTDGIVDPF
jgi:hypothetical protein